MPRRIEVELTSSRDDGSFTWRAVGAKQPKGIVEAAILPANARVGDVLRAEAEFDLEGVTLIAIVPAQEKHRNEPQRIEVIGSPRADEPLVTSSVTQRAGRDERRGPRREKRERTDGGGRPPGAASRRPAPETGERGGEAEGPRGPRRPRPARGAERPDRPRPPRSPKPEAPARPKPKRLRPQRTHRAALLAELPAEHRPIAEQVLQGDIPAVRQAIERENEARASRGEAPIDGTELITIAERLRPRVRTAEWRDRADAALADLGELDLRDLRSVVVAADGAARDDETRALAAQLREGLAKRVDEEQAAWIGELTEAIDEGRVVRALRISSRPPKAGTILRPELAAKLSEAASAALTELSAPDRWAVLLDAVAHSPVRLTVRPQSVPKEPPAELLDAVGRLSSRIPEIAALLGVEATPPSRPAAPRRPPRPRPQVPDPSPS